jgi:hypothetical protein
MPTIAMQKTNGWLNLLRDGGSGAANPKITYVALGTGTTPTTISDTQLSNEAFRKAVTAFTNGTTGQLLIDMYLAPGDYVLGDIEEVGFFGGSAASATRNSGVLVARGLWSHNPKTSGESIQFEINPTIS